MSITLNQLTEQVKSNTKWPSPSMKLVESELYGFVGNSIPPKIFPQRLGTSISMSGGIVIGQAAPFAGIHPSTPSDPNIFTELYNHHPWLHSIRDMMRMLSGEIELPHAIKFSGNSRQRKKARRAEERGEVAIASTPGRYGFHNSRCRVCLEAAKKRRAYQRELNTQ